MNTDDERRFDLSRRTVLGSIGALGVGAALGGAGTAAFFSDEETFTDNRLVAGEFDLKVDWQESYNGEKIDAYPDRNSDGVQDLYTLQEIETDPTVVGLSANATDEEIGAAYRGQFADVPDDLVGRPPVIALDDVKPGDWGEVTFSAHLFDNPGYLWMTGDLLAAAENGHTEPEEDDEDEVGGPDTSKATGTDVELLDAVEVTIWHDDGNNQMEDVETLWIDGSAQDVPIEDLILFEGSLREALARLGEGTGLPLDADPTTSTRDCFAPSTTRYVGFAWEVPVDHANEIQTDSATFDLGFYTEQCRHNDGSGMAPEFAQGSVGSGDFSEISYEKAFSMQALSRGGSGRGEIQIHGDSGGVESTTLWGSNPFPANTDVPFTAEVDPAAQTASLTVNGVTVTDDDVTDGDANAGSTGEPEWPGGVPSEVDVAITAASGDANVTTLVDDVTVKGYSTTPASIGATGGLTHLDLTGVPAGDTVTVTGVLRFEGATADFDGQDFVGVDWR